MKQYLLKQAIAIMMSMLTPETLQKFADYVLDFIEDQIRDSSNTYDDKILVPLIKMIRATFNIPDNDEA